MQTSRWTTAALGSEGGATQLATAVRAGGAAAGESRAGDPSPGVAVIEGEGVGVEHTVERLGRTNVVAEGAFAEVLVGAPYVDAARPSARPSRLDARISDRRQKMRRNRESARHKPRISESGAESI